MKRWGALLVLGALGCTPDFRVVGNPAQPLVLDLSSGVPTTRVRGTGAVVPAVVDTGSPVSSLSNGAGCQPNTALVLDSVTNFDQVQLAFPDLHPFCLD